MRELQPQQLLLLLACLMASAAAQSAVPRVTRYIGDTMVRVNISVDQTKFLTCPNRDGFLGVADREGRAFVSTSPSFTVDMRYTRGNLDDLRRMRQQKLGAYHCLYTYGGFVNAYSIILSEEPSEDQISKSDISRIGTGHGEDQFDLYCRLPSSDPNDIIWEIYRDNTGLFEEHARGRMLSLTYTTMSREHGSGMTIYRCFNQRNPEEMQYNWAKYSENLQIRPVRPSNYENTPLPYNVRYMGLITLECHGNGTSTAIKHPNWTFKPEGSDTFVPVVQDPPALEINFLTTLSTLTIQRMMPKYSGFYKCDKDDVNHVVQLKVYYGEVVIKDYSKGTYPLKSDNFITCEVPEKTMTSEASFTVLRPNLPPVTLKGATTVDGFTTSVDSQRNLVIRFAKRDDIENARLECDFYRSSDFTTTRTVLPQLSLTDFKSQPSYYFMECKKDREFGTPDTLKVYRLNLDGTLNRTSLAPFGISALQVRFYSQRAATDKFAEFVCVAPYEGKELRSNVLTYGTPDVTADISVDGERNAPARVFLGGRDVTLDCHFSRLPATRVILPSAVSLMKDDRKLTLPQVPLNLTTFRYVIRNAGPSDNGNYRCEYDYTGTGPVRGASTAITGSFRSPSSNLQFCTGSQFVCDSTCKDASLMCDKKRDCADGSDERPEYCEKCEPNEVKCEPLGGRSPEKRCVLKHWLCDGQDDCGNGFDEDLTRHAKWCFKDRGCPGCRPEETCCPNNPGRCIQRNYECDKEPDCEAGAEELRCSTNQCLRISSPTSRSVVNKRVGEDLNLTCTAVGMDRPTINWRRNWAALPMDGVTETNEVVAREPAGDYTVLGTLKFVRLTKDMSGIYNCEAVNNCKRELSFEIDLRVSD